MTHTPCQARDRFIMINFSLPCFKLVRNNSFKKSGVSAQTNYTSSSIEYKYDKPALDVAVRFARPYHAINLLISLA